MNAYFSQMTAVNPDVGYMVGWVTFISMYVILKTSLWWALFGTGRLLLGKYSLSEWAFRSGVGLLGFAALAVLSVFLWLAYSPDSNVYMCLVWVTFAVSMRITLREILSLFGLLRGDWNPFGPELRFIAWDETYLLCWLGNGRSSGGRRTPWGSHADQEVAWTLQNMYDKHSGYTY